MSARAPRKWTCEVIRSVGTAAVVATLLAVSSQLPASATVFGHSVRLPIPGGFPKASDVTVSDVSCTSKGNCVAVGEYLLNNNVDLPRPIIFTEVGGKWTSVLRPALPSNATGPYSPLSSVSCPSLGHCVASGSYSVGEVYKPFVLTETTGKWGREVEVPLPGDASNAKTSLAFLFSISCSLTTLCVAVGQYDTASAVEGFIDTESSGAWTSMRAPLSASATSSELTPISCLRADRWQV